MEYSLDNITYSADLPMKTDVGEYDIWYRVKGDSNHNDMAAITLTTKAVIAPQQVTSPIIEFTPGSVTYDGNEHKPAVTVKDNNTRVIPDTEYTVNYGTTDWTTVGNHTVTVTDKNGGNYAISEKSEPFKILPMGQSPLSIVNQPGKVQYGDSFTLSTLGGSGTGQIVWTISTGNGFASIDQNGLVSTQKSGGPVTVTATKAADSNYGESSASWSFSVEKKPVTPIVTAKSRKYVPNSTDVELIVSWKYGDLVGTDTIDLVTPPTGTFENPDAGANKTVMIAPGTPSGEFGNYIIIWPETTTASIEKVDAKIATPPTPNNVPYNADNPQPLLIAGTTANGIGEIVYSLSQYGEYSTDVPKATGAGNYSVWYKVADTVNYTGISPVEIQVEITDPSGDTSVPDSPGTDGTSTPDSTPDTTTTPVTKAPAKAPSVSKTPAASSTPITADVSNGTASTTLDTVTGSKLVAEAAASQSKSLVIKPEITGSVTKTSVSIPAATVSQLQSETKADLTVSTPIADVTIPSAALSTLSAAGGTVDVVTEHTGNTVALTLTANGETIEQVPGGVTLAVPAEDAGPGTVAVLVHDDGTRETIPKSVVDNGVLNIPLDGTATIEIVDNSKSFEDVPETDWAADAVAFTSARELFNGTSDTTFSPNEPMSRGMLAAVLYNLEGRPDQTEAGPFRDVSSDAWYADGVAWAAQNGIVNGDGSGEFNPDADISREQFAVMLWKYAGSPEASGEDLDFTDAGEANDYAAEALRWAVSNGVMSGYGDGKLDPQGTATRAQAAQMLKNFLENT